MSGVPMLYILSFLLATISSYGNSTISKNYHWYSNSNLQNFNSHRKYSSCKNIQIFLIICSLTCVQIFCICFFFFSTTQSGVSSLYIYCEFCYWFSFLLLLLVFVLLFHTQLFYFEKLGNFSTKALQIIKNCLDAICRKSSTMKYIRK